MDSLKHYIFHIVIYSWRSFSESFDAVQIQNGKRLLWHTFEITGKMLISPYFTHNYVVKLFVIVY